MRKIMLLILGFCFSLQPTASAIAGPPLTTAPLIPQSPGGAIFCEVVNVSTKPLAVSAEIVRSDGVQMGVCGPLPALNPGEVMDCGGSVFSGQSHYCRFTGGSKKQLRASIVLWSDNGAGMLVTTAALPAH